MTEFMDDIEEINFRPDHVRDGRARNGRREYRSPKGRKNLVFSGGLAQSNKRNKKITLATQGVGEPKCKPPDA
jgi:hypothetical protein